MAYSNIEATDNLNAGRTKVNENFRSASTIDPVSGAKSFQIHQNQIGPSANDMPIEIVNIGYTGHGATDDIHQNTTGVVRLNGRLNLVRNMQWDQVNAKWLTPIQTADAYGSSCLEVGGEAVILHATPSGVDFTDVPHEVFMAKANGTDGETNNTISSGYFAQSKACIFARFNSTAYDPAATNNCWNQTAGTDPLLWLSTAEVKNTENELMRIEGNGVPGVYGGLMFAKSGGTLGTRTVVTTGDVMGRIASKAYDGDEYHQTAYIQFVSRGTIANNAVAQSIQFATSATNGASIATRMEVGESGQIRLFNNYFRQEYTAITTIPLYSSVGYSPILTSSTIWQLRALGSTTGGGLWENFSTTSNTASALLLRGIQGGTAPSVANSIFQVMKNDGTGNNFGAIAAGEIGFHFRNNATTLIEILGSGNTGHLVTTPTAVVHIAASNTTRASLCLNPGAAPTSPVNGDIWIDSTAHTMHVRINGVTRSINLT